MVWSIETDDFHGKCHSRKFDLIKTIHESFIDGELTIPPPPTTTTRVCIAVYNMSKLYFHCKTFFCIYKYINWYFSMNYGKMDVSEPKWVNSVSNTIGVNSLRSGVTKSYINF